MEAAGRIVEDILRHITEEGSVKKEDLKDKFGLEEENTEGILKFLAKSKLIRGDDPIKITESGQEFLQL